MGKPSSLLKFLRRLVIGRMRFGKEQVLCVRNEMSFVSPADPLTNRTPRRRNDYLHHYAHMCVQQLSR